MLPGIIWFAIKSYCWTLLYSYPCKTSNLEYHFAQLKIFLDFRCAHPRYRIEPKRIKNNCLISKRDLHQLLFVMTSSFPYTDKCNEKTRHYEIRLLKSISSNIIISYFIRYIINYINFHSYVFIHVFGALVLDAETCNMHN